MDTSIDLDHPAPGVTRFTVPLALGSPDHLHVHLLETPDGDLLVDTGARGSEHALRAGLAAAGADRPRVFVTHGHLDHWGIATDIAPSVFAHPDIARTFAFARGDIEAPVGSPFADAAALADAFAGFRQLVGDVPEVTPVTDGDRFGAWTVLHTPGHDPAHLCLYRAEDRVLLCGDLLLPGFTPNVQPAWDGGDALGQFLASLERVAAMEVELVLPAHGAAYRDARARAQELTAHHADRLSDLERAIGGGLSALEELTASTFGTRARSPEDRMLALMETYAHLEHLERRGAALRRADGSWAAAATT